MVAAGLTLNCKLKTLLNFESCERLYWTYTQVGFVVNLYVFTVYVSLFVFLTKIFQFEFVINLSKTDLHCINYVTRAASSKERMPTGRL